MLRKSQIKIILCNQSEKKENMHLYIHKLTIKRTILNKNSSSDSSVLFEARSWMCCFVSWNRLIENLNVNKTKSEDMTDIWHAMIDLQTNFVLQSHICKVLVTKYPLQFPPPWGLEDKEPSKLSFGRWLTFVSFSLNMCLAVMCTGIKCLFQRRRKCFCSKMFRKSNLWLN